MLQNIHSLDLLPEIQSGRPQSRDTILVTKIEQLPLSGEV
jgi:hypothetical protein